MLLFEEVVPGARPLAILVDDRGAVPLFGSEARAQDFLAATDLGSDLEPVEVSRAGLIRALESVADEVEYVALDPPPAAEGGMRVRMGSCASWWKRSRRARRTTCSGSARANSSSLSRRPRRAGRRRR